MRVLLTREMRACARVHAESQDRLFNTYIYVRTNLYVSRKRRVLVNREWRDAKHHKETHCSRGFRHGECRPSTKLARNNQTMSSLQKVRIVLITSDIYDYSSEQRWKSIASRLFFLWLVLILYVTITLIPRCARMTAKKNFLLSLHPIYS